MEDNLVIILNSEKKLRLPYQLDFLPLANNCRKQVANNITLVEKVLISKLKVGDYLAFSYIFTAYYQDLVMFASRFTRNLNNAEEIVQDTFVKIWEEHESVKIDTSLKSYLLKLVQNKCIDWCRHNKVMQTHFNFIMESPPQFEYETDSYLLYSELQKQIENALEMMPEAISEAFRMNRYKGLKYYEIAEEMHVSVRTIEVRIGKALQILRNYLKEYFTSP
jgi:RNA polymerase sigma-70 factor (ECF subfamily)